MKGQLGVETLIALSILAFFLLTIVGFSVVRSKDISYLNDYLEARKICFDLKNTAEDAFSVGNGTRASFTLPERLNNRYNYQVKVNSLEKTIRISWEDKVYSCFVSANITNKTHAYFEVKKGENFIHNYEGDVIIEKV